MSEGLGLRKKRSRTCVRCSTLFVTDKATARYCSDACRRAMSRYGRTYGQVNTAHMLKVWRS